jgi:hypothetical protein
MVEGIIFKECTVGGKPIRSSTDADFKINEFTGNIVFLP